MKPLSLSLVLFSINYLFIPKMDAGVLVTGNAITFSESDFVSDVTADKSWTIYTAAESAPNTLIWDAATVNIPSQDTAWITHAYASEPNTFVTWKIVVPNSLAITDFTWGVNFLILNGSGDDEFAWQYSIDNTNWTNLSLYDNGALTQYDNQAYSASLGTASSELFIRGASIEGPIVGDSGYFAIASNNPTGGVNPFSFIEVTTAAVPEPSTVLLFAGSALGLLAYRSRRTSAAL